MSEKDDGEIDRNPHNPYVCASCLSKIPEGARYEVVGLTTVCVDCGEGSA